MHICPLCDQLHIYIGSTTYYVDCPIRRCDQKSKLRWLNQYTLAWRNVSNDNLFESILINDPGPTQHCYVSHTYTANYWLAVSLCSVCIRALLRKTQKQQKEEISKRVGKQESKKANE